MQKKLFLLDAFALIFRAYYALIRNPRITSKGKNTNAQFGFTNTLFELINKEKPTHLAVCFDVAGKTERHTDFADYKANRQEAPEDLLASIPDIKKIIEGFNIPVIGVEGYEADDVIGTLAWEAHDAGYEVFMVTPDKDYGQLVRDGINIYKPAYQGGDVEIMGPKEVCAKWDIERVDQVVDILGLMGDTVDNIPGIPGVGEKTAAKLLKEYSTLENVLANAENIKGALGEKVRAGKESAIMSKKLATIITKSPVEFHEENFKLKEWNKETLKEVFAELEFKTLGKRILGDDFNMFQSAPVGVQTDLFGNAVELKKTESNKTEIVEESLTPGLIAEKNISNTTHHYILVDSEEKIKSLVNDLLKQKEICFDTETTNIDANEADLVGMSFAYKKGEAYYVPCPADRKSTEKVLQQFSTLFNSTEIIWIGQNLKYDLLVLKWYDIELVKEYAAEDADITFQLKNVFTPLLKEKDVERVFNEVENPLVKVLTDMEFEGIKVDVGFLNDYSKELEREAKKCEESVYLQAGVRFNLASPKQLGEVLFDKLQIDPKAKKTKTGQYATGEDVLLKLANQHKIVDDILGFRELTKLKSTYVDALPQMINSKTGRVHTSYAQAVAVTGRLSSNNPNLQNIPVRTDRGREIRKAFVPRDSKHILVSADYSQIELRIVAAISGDPNMCEVYGSSI